MFKFCVGSKGYHCCLEFKVSQLLFYVFGTLDNIVFDKRKLDPWLITIKPLVIPNIQLPSDPSKRHA